MAKAQKQKTVSVSVISQTPVIVTDPVHARGWGDKAQEVEVTGAAIQIEVIRSGKMEFSIRIFEDGSIVLCQHESRYTMSFGSGEGWLTNVRPWKD